MSSKRGSGTQTTMCYIVAYDIPDDRRRTRGHQILMGFGKWTRYSLFECFLTRRDLILLQSKLAPYLLSTRDSVRFYPLCANCVGNVETISDSRQSMSLSSSFKLSSERFCIDELRAQASRRASGAG